MDKICNTCALYIPEQSGCARTQMIELPDHTCNHWCCEVPTCSVCGRRFIPPVTYLADDDYAVICPNCFKARGTCGLCQSNSYCDFQQNPIGIPQMVPITRRQGNMVMTQTVPNPERIKATCIASGCKCYHKDDEHEWCCRQFGCCGNYTMLGVKKEVVHECRETDTVPTDNGNGTEATGE